MVTGMARSVGVDYLSHLDLSSLSVSQTKPLFRFENYFLGFKAPAPCSSVSFSLIQVESELKFQYPILLAFA
jgi:hypothetical protein